MTQTMSQTVVMTGATRGIGRVAAQRLLTRQPGTHLVLLGRGDATDVVEDLQKTGGTVSVIPTDLASLHSVYEAATTVAHRCDTGALPPLGAVVCNAGVQHTSTLVETVDGFEATFAVNVLANHILFRILHQHVRPGGRVVVTVSDTHVGDLRHNLGMVPGPRWLPTDILAHTGAFPPPGRTRAGRTAYSTSKLAAIYLLHEYARRFPTGPAVYGYNPGLVPGTGLTRDADVLSRFAMRWLMPALTVSPLATTSAKAGALLAEAVVGDIPAPSGAYIDRDHVADSSPESYDPDRERQLWDAVEHLTTPFMHQEDNT
ncbi:SDR family NAD(P)-dependent oxidoreductase [Corynebacterium glyciniphilum]|uniref:SDR family NAD(P)-dependent oxidoreductase n=1 Tax=Corynebacterium glyciniphilum TaxID=1404244 RepID=UPI003FD24087